MKRMVSKLFVGDTAKVDDRWRVIKSILDLENGLTTLYFNEDKQITLYNTHYIEIFL